MVPGIEHRLIRFHQGKGHQGAANAVALFPDNCRFITGGSDGQLKIWDIATSEELQTLGTHGSKILGVAISQDGRYIISASGDHLLKVWDAETSGLVTTFSGEGPIMSCAIASDGRTILAGDQLGWVYILRLEFPDLSE
jgi:WD40 repeat protein